MREPNPRLRAREKFELSLDGRQVASIVVGALVVLAVVFVLGLNVGKQLAARQAEGRGAGDLDALDRAPAPPPAKAEPLTFHDRLTKEPPAPPPPPEAAPPPQAPPPTPPEAAPPPAAAPAGPESAPPPAALKPWTVQLAAAGDRAEADRFAARFAALHPRIEDAIVPGKGRFFRVRVGSFETKDAAQRYLKDVARETGAKGIVVPTR
jgi:cell division septation protein DedD